METLSESKVAAASRIQELSKELLARRKCKESFLDWCKFALEPLGFTPARHHEALIELLQKVNSGEIKRLMISMPPGSAKALALDTPVPTPFGWSTMGALAIGDEVFSDTGEVCRVTWKSPIHHDRPVYRLTTDCGDAIVADEQHEWRVRLCGKRPVFKLKQTHALAKIRSKRPMIERCLPLQTVETVLPIEPYVLGVWLGNGTASSVAITSAKGDTPWMRAEFERLGYQTSERCRPDYFGVLGVRHLFTALNLLHDPFHKTFGGKYIPPAYLRAAVPQRLALLQGLIDTDGTVCPRSGQITFCNTNRALAEGVRELAYSLGVKASWREGRATLYGKDCGPAYHVVFMHAEAARLPRKARDCRFGRRTPGAYIDVAALPQPLDTVCIEVDSPSHLFLAGRSMLPTHNSTYTSQLFPPFWMIHHPNTKIIAGSNTERLSTNFSRIVRGHVLQNPSILGYKVDETQTAVGEWAANNGCQYLAVGSEGSVLGNRADLLILDDVYKSRADAQSDTRREAVWNWYSNDILSRLKPEGRVIIVMTRFHSDDLIGRLLDMEADNWTVVRFTAVCDDPDNDPLGRQEGALLWPEYQTARFYEEKRRIGGEQDWASNYQQRPAPTTGNLFNGHYLENNRLAFPPDDITHTVRAWDLAGGQLQKSDYTVGLKLGRRADGRYTILDVLRFRAEPAKVEATIKQVAEMDGKQVKVALSQDPGQAGLAQVQYLVRSLAGFNVLSERETGSKLVRATPVASQVNAGNVSMVQGAWNREFLNEISNYPSTRWDDQIDALSRAFQVLWAPKAPAYRRHFDFMQR